MRNIRFLLLLLSLVFALGLALLRPLPGRGEDGLPDLGPGPAPADTNPDQVAAPEPAVPIPAEPLRRKVRKLAAAKHTHQTLAVGVRAVRYAKHLLGVPYRYGGTSPRTGFDCSGLVRYVYGHFGISLAHSSFADYWRGRRVARGALKPGDLVFFDGAGHVGIYVGHGRFIHAPHSGTVVRISTMSGWYGARFVGARRIS